MCLLSRHLLAGGDGDAHLACRSPAVRMRTRVGLLVLGSTSARFDRWIGCSTSTMPACRARPGLKWRLLMLMSWTSAVPLLGHDLAHDAALAALAAGQHDDVVALLDACERS